LGSINVSSLYRQKHPDLVGSRPARTVEEQLENLELAIQARLDSIIEDCIAELALEYHPILTTNDSNELDTDVLSKPGIATKGKQRADAIDVPQLNNEF
jgi:hypothetical protein